ncbi:hypothetical protein [Pseudoduganella buxea]|uniref:Uncharacterized protein n=2 Tax=Pseudoduganella buxea TaxID=1949069 RepID=A0A6I3T4D2_9BURK|nr:hypothetical protein [Pseudoduganella buxea]MTV56381.1 hypothetical protein [Pseudoduganella buxea]
MDDTMLTKLVSETQVDALRVIIMAESREEEARKRGRTWTKGVVPFFAQKLIAAAKDNMSKDEVEMHAANAAMAAWLCDSIYDGVTAEAFTRSDIVFTLLPNGAVKYDRVRVSKV